MKNDASTFVGQAIFDLGDRICTLVLRTRQRFNIQERRTPVRTARETGTTTPILANIGYEIRVFPFFQVLTHMDYFARHRFCLRNFLEVKSK